MFLFGLKIVCILISVLFKLYYKCKKYVQTLNKKSKKYNYDTEFAKNQIVNSLKRSSSWWLIFNGVL